MHPQTLICKSKNDRVAQLVEHLPFKERVLGSSPSPVTKCFYKKVKRSLGRFQSGQMGRTVTPLSYDFAGSNPALPTKNPDHLDQDFLFYMAFLNSFNMLVKEKSCEN